MYSKITYDAPWPEKKWTQRTVERMLRSSTCQTQPDRRSHSRNWEIPNSFASRSISSQYYRSRLADSHRSILDWPPDRWWAQWSWIWSAHFAWRSASRPLSEWLRTSVRRSTAIRRAPCSCRICRCSNWSRFSADNRHSAGWSEAWSKCLEVCRPCIRDSPMRSARCPYRCERIVSSYNALIWKWLHLFYIHDQVERAWTRIWQMNWDDTDFFFK